MAEAAHPNRRELMRTPVNMPRQITNLYREWLAILFGTSARDVPAKDWRFADPAWRDQPMYKRLAQGYLAFCDAIDKVVDDTPDWRKRERARFVTGILTSAMSPTNTLVGNPAALKRAYETGGMSLVRGTKNLVEDLRHNDGMPSQVRRSDFKLGVNVAATPGAVMLRTERFELLRYQPTTAKVREIPTLNPPGNPKATYWLGPSPGPDPEQWLEKATKHTGTWWEVWVDWSSKRTGREKPAPKTLGTRKYKLLGQAPGTYVMAKAKTKAKA